MLKLKPKLTKLQLMNDRFPFSRLFVTNYRGSQKGKFSKRDSFEQIGDEEDFPKLT